MCTLDDDELVSWEPDTPGMWRYTCTNPKRAEAYSWLTTGQGHVDKSESIGLAEELGCATTSSTLSGTRVRFSSGESSSTMYAMAHPDELRRLGASVFPHGVRSDRSTRRRRFSVRAAGKLGSREGCSR